MARTSEHHQELQILSTHWRRFVGQKIRVYVLPGPATSLQIQGPDAGVYRGLGAPSANICSFQIRLKRWQGRDNWFGMRSHVGMGSWKLCEPSTKSREARMEPVLSRLRRKGMRRVEPRNRSRR